MTTQQQSEAILEKYTILLSLNKVQVELIEDTAIQCAITEVEACIELLNILEHNDSYYQQILSHLKQM